MSLGLKCIFACERYQQLDSILTIDFAASMCCVYRSDQLDEADAIFECMPVSHTQQL